MKLTRLSLVFFLPALAPAAEPSADFLSALAEYVALRQSVLDRSTIEKPAKFQWIRSDDGNQDSSSIDVGLSFKAKALDRATWRAFPYVEYHRQTLTAKRQDNFQVGGSLDWATGNVAQGLAALSQFTASFKDDRYASGESFLARLNTLPVYPAADIGWGSAALVGKSLITWQPTLGLQYEDAENVRKSKRSGHTARAFLGFEVALYPNGLAWNRRCELLLSHGTWRNFSASPAFAALYERTQTLFSVSLSVFLDAKKRLGVGIDYVDGQNPEQGLQKQKTTTLALKLKV